MVVRSHDVNIDKEYAQWIADLKAASKREQCRARMNIAE